MPRCTFTMCALGCLEKQRNKETNELKDQFFKIIRKIILPIKKQEKEQDQLKVSTKKVLLSKVNGIGKKQKMAVFSSFILNLNIHEAIVEDNTKEITQATALKIMQMQVLIMSFVKWTKFKRKTILHSGQIYFPFGTHIKINSYYFNSTIIK